MDASFDHVPDDVILTMFGFLEPFEVSICAWVCKRWAALAASTPALRRNLLLFGAHPHVMTTAAVRCAANRGYASVVAWALSVGSVADATVPLAAAMGGHGFVLRLLFERGVPFDSAVAAAVAAECDVPTMAWLLRDVDCPIDDGTLRNIVLRGSVPLLRVVQAAGYEFDGGCMQTAAYLGSVEVLDWLYHEAGCRLDASMVFDATRRGHMEMLQWLVKHRCPMDAYATAVAATLPTPDVLKWLVEWAGCPFNPLLLRSHCTSDQTRAYVETLFP